MKRIQLLHPQLANQIAAGEVVERPAAVLKELLENSIDADARQIDIDIEKGGIQLIRVRDNGMGIHPDDLALALNRHATSKIYELHDLDAISSLGFRGEALASISSVSRLTLTSCLREKTDAWQIKSVGHNADPVMTPAAHTAGTTVEMYDLFFNTPARRRFLRTEQTEFSHLEDLFKRIVLSHYEVGFTLRHNQKIIRQLRPANTEKERTQRAAEIFGNLFMSNAVAIDNQSSNGMRLRGWIALSSFSRNHTDLQYCYVNNRLVRDKLINHAIRLAYQDSLPPGRFPAFILYLEIDPSVVDVNVHPTKHEVRFHESRQIHDFLFSSIRNALEQTPSLDIPIPFSVQEPSKTYVISPQSSRAHNAYNTISRYDRDKNHSISSYSTSQPQENITREIINKEISQSLPLGRALSQLHEKYILAENPEGLVIVDIHAARKQVITLRLKNAVISQPLLIPQSITVTENLTRCAEENETLLRTLGFEISAGGTTTLVIRKIPSLLKGLELSTLIPNLLNILITTQNDISAAMHCIAHYVAQQTISALSIDEMNALLREIEGFSETQVWRQLHLSEL
jgi:DNA mismatch repair protein MutL